MICLFVTYLHISFIFTRWQLLEDQKIMQRLELRLANSMVIHYVVRRPWMEKLPCWMPVVRTNSAYQYCRIFWRTFTVTTTWLVPNWGCCYSPQNHGAPGSISLEGVHRSLKRKGKSTKRTMSVWSSNTNSTLSSSQSVDWRLLQKAAVRLRPLMMPSMTTYRSFATVC